jgi:DNA-binding beta-propeller fold protein YncE
MWHLDAYGNLLAPVSIESFTKEPTGIAAWVTPSGAQHLFITDDDQQKIFEIDAANPTVVLNSFLTTSFGCVDPEDITINPNNGNLFVMSENDHKIYEITQSGTKVATTTLPNTFVPHTDPLAEDAGAEAIAYDPVKDVFWVTGGFSPDIFEVSRSGQILNMINVLEQYPNPSLLNQPQGVYLKGIELAPSSDGSGHLSLWVTDYGRDQYPDGRVFEILLPDLAPGASVATTSSVAIQQAASPQSTLQQPDLLPHSAPHLLESSGHSHQFLGGLMHEPVHDWVSFHHPDYLI